MREYKGIYYNENKDPKYFEGGAHFRYSDLYLILKSLGGLTTFYYDHQKISPILPKPNAKSKSKTKTINTKNKIQVRLKQSIKSQKNDNIKITNKMNYVYSKPKQHLSQTNSFISYKKTFTTSTQGIIPLKRNSGDISKEKHAHLIERSLLHNSSVKRMNSMVSLEECRVNSKFSHNSTTISLSKKTLMSSSSTHILKYPHSRNANRIKGLDSMKNHKWINQTAQSADKDKDMSKRKIDEKKKEKSAKKSDTSLKKKFAYKYHEFIKENLNKNVLLKKKIEGSDIKATGAKNKKCNTRNKVNSLNYGTSFRGNSIHIKNNEHNNSIVLKKRMVKTINEKN